MMKKILIIDDDKKLTDLLEEFLGENKFKTKSIHESVTAVREVDGFSPDLIILDITLPEMDGFQVLRSVRKEHEPAHRMEKSETGGQGGA